MTQIFNFIQRYGVWAVLVMLSLAFLFKFFSLFGTIINLIIMIVLVEMAALALSGVALFIYISINFTKTLSAGEDKKFNSVEQHAFARVIASVFLGVHILVGLIYLASYQTTILNILSGN